MVEVWTLLAFIPAALALNLSPGADMMFCLGIGLRSGPKAAIASSAGISTGSLVHVAVAGMGLGAVVGAIPWMFDVIRWVGVAYLLWLAWHVLKAQPVQSTAVQKTGLGKAFRDGMVVNLLNPKVILFVLAFLPQFVDPSGPIFGQFVVFGLVLAVGGFVINGGVGVFAGTLGQRLTGPHFTRGLGWISAGIFSALAARLAVIEKV